MAINCLNHNASAIISCPQCKKYQAIIRLSYINHQHSYVYAHSIHEPALNDNRKCDFPILISDHGATLDRMNKSDKFHARYIKVWLAEIANKFNVILDVQTPYEIQSKYHCLDDTPKASLTSLTHYGNLYQQLCSFIAFIITANDTYDLYFDDPQGDTYQVPN